MATNKSMIELLERTVVLIDNMNRDMKELNAINKIVKLHIIAQKKQNSTDYNDNYRYDEDKGEYIRVFREE